MRRTVLALALLAAAPFVALAVGYGSPAPCEALRLATTRMMMRELPPPETGDAAGLAAGAFSLAAGERLIGAAVARMRPLECARTLWRVQTDGWEDAFARPRLP